MKHTTETMKSYWLEWQHSGIKRKEFCKQRELSYSAFCYWCRRFDSSPGSGFSEIPLGTGTTCLFEVTFPSGARLSFQGEPQADWLKRLVS